MDDYLILEIDKHISNEIVGVGKTHAQKCVNLSGYIETVRIPDVYRIN